MNPPPFGLSCSTLPDMRIQRHISNKAIFNIRYEDRNQQLQYAWQTSWGVSTRMVGALIMAHGDDSGLRLPPRVAPLQIIIVPISLGDWKTSVLPVAEQLEKEIKQAGFRVKLDAREEFTPGWKFSDWEMRGAPLRLEIGPRDVKQNQVLAVRRDNREKIPVPLASLVEKLPDILPQQLAAGYFLEGFIHKKFFARKKKALSCFLKAVNIDPGNSAAKRELSELIGGR